MNGRNRVLPTHGPRRALASALVATCLACVNFNPPNEPIESIDPEYGYRPQDASRMRDAGHFWLLLAFSGGGTRAAALSYGVLEALRDIEVEIDGERVRLIDEIDMISGVSGGSFPAAYYGLFGDRIFEDFEEDFLRKNVQRSLFLRALNPWNTIRLFTPYLSRSDIASRYYHEHVFDEATFADLAEAHGPRIHINATDLPSGMAFRYNQDSFDAICSDLNPFWISYAVASSSAVPVLLSPVTLRNYAGGCGYQRPEWWDEALASRETNPRAWRVASSAEPFLDSDRKKYIHLVDGGIADNLGVRMPLDRVAALGGVAKTIEADGLRIPDQIIFLVVNAETEPDPTIDLKAAAPSLAASLNLVSGAQIRRYNFDSLLLVEDTLREAAAALSTPEHPVSGYMVEVSFDLLQDEEERRYFKRLPTSFKLSDEQVDRLREVGRRLVHDSKAMKRFLAEFE